MALNYAEVWSPELLPIRIQNALISPFITTNVNWLDAKTFHFTRMITSGYKNHSRAGGWNAGTYGQFDHPFTLTFDRDIEFLIDKADVDETNKTASIKNIAMVFERTQATPEGDAYFFHKTTQKAIEASLSQLTAEASWSADNVVAKLKTIFGQGKLKTYRANGGVVCYARSFILDLLSLASDFQRKIEVTSIAEGGAAVETRITELDGVYIIEVFDDDRFYDKFDFNSEDGGYQLVATSYALTEDEAIVAGKTYYTKNESVYTAVTTPKIADIATYYEKTIGSRRLNVWVGSAETIKYVPKISSIYYFEPGTHTKGDGWLYQNRFFSDAFIFPNGKNGNIDSIFVDIDTTEYTG